MKKSLLFVLSFVMISGSLFAQMADPQKPLTNDPNVKIGKLENGLTYYIQHNTKPEKRAEFYLVTNVGAIQENERQAGLAHFLEHMALNGTKNFPGKGIISYMESIGCNFGDNVNAGTGVEQTSYMLNNVPVTRNGIVDSCLLIMHDYAAFVTNDPTEINNERGVVVEEWRTRRTAEWRVFEQSLPYLYKGSKYATCNLIGTQEGLQTFEPKELQDFYKTWYRPDLQAVVVVGDIDVNYVENKIKSLFADISAPTTPNPKKLIPIPENDEPIIGIVTDPELSNSSVDFVIKSEPVPAEMRSLGMVYMVDMFKSLIGSMLNDRLAEIAEKPDAPFIQAYAQFAALTQSCDAAYFSTACKDGETVSAYNALMLEIEKVKRFGFTQAELDRAKTTLLRYLERAAQNEADRKNPEMINSIINHFVNQKPILAPSYELEVAKGYMPFIQLDQLNQIANELITEENRVLVCGSPRREGLSIPTEADFLNVMKSVADAQLEAYTEEVSDAPIVDASKLKAGKVVSEKASVFGSTEWTLSNGVKVVIKPTDFKKDEVSLYGWTPGGRSMLADELQPSVEANVWQLWSTSCGLGDFTNSQIAKKLTGKVVGASPFMGSYQNGVEAGGSPQDIATIFELFNAYYTVPRFTEEDFAAPMAQLNAVIPNTEKTPAFKLQSELNKTMYNNSPRRCLISSELLTKVSLANLEKAYRQCFSNVNGMTLVIVGNVDLATLKPLVELYIGSLPSQAKANAWVKDDAALVTGKVSNHFKVTMETPKTSIIKIYSSTLDQTLENQINMSVLESVVNQTYIKSLREEEGGTYAASVQASMVPKPNGQAFLLVYFDTDPDKQMKMGEIANADIQNLALNLPSDEFVSKAKENILKTHQEKLISNAFWSDALQTWYREGGLDSVTDFDATVNAVTPATLQKFIKNFLKAGNFVDLSMNAE